MYGNIVIQKYLSKSFAHTSCMMIQIQQAYRWKYLNTKLKQTNLSMFRQRMREINLLDHEVFIENLISMLGTMFT